MPFIETLGQQMAGQAGGGILGLMLGGINDERQFNQQQRLNILNREMLDYNYQKQYEMWKKTGAVGQVEQLKKAGLNPALVYGMSGAGGGTTGSGGGGGSQATGHSGEALGLMNGMNMALMNAQIENIKADTDAKRAGIPKTGAETQSILQGITNAKTQNELMLKDKELKDLQIKFEQGTVDNKIGTTETMLNIAKEQLQIIENDATISEETQKDKIRIIKLEAIQKGLENSLIIAETKLKGEQLKQVKESIYQMSQQTRLMIENKALGWETLKDAGLERLMQDNNESNPLSGIIGGIIGIISGGKAAKEVKGFRGSW